MNQSLIFIRYNKNRSVRDNTLAPKNKPKYEPQSAMKVEKSASLISSLFKTFAPCSVNIASKGKVLSNFCFSVKAVLSQCDLLQLGFKQSFKFFEVM